MKLERMHIQGFKSFKDRTTIHFDDGITGIVGPNGCGKSNIVDALFWVMGEQSAKHLRGTKMSDLIFSGSKKYSPGSFAEVSLVLNNTTHKHIHIGSKVVNPQEIQLTRKLYRNGETEYRINNMQARLKDIQEVFMDTGAGAKSYSIIAQGEIDRLVKAKPVERRVMIEEVAGITKFKVRKKESLRKIDQANANLERINDLKKEIYKQLKTLEGQAEKAERAKSLKEKVKKAALSVSTHKELDLVEKVIKFSSDLKETGEKLEDSKVKLNVLESSIQTEKNQKTALIDQIEAEQTSFNTDNMELVSIEEKFNFSKKSIEEKQKYIEEKRKEIVEQEEELSSRIEKIEEISQRLENFENPDENSKVDLKFLEQEVEKFQETYKTDEQEFFDSQQNLRQFEFNQTKLSAELNQTKSILESKSHLLTSIVEEIGELEAYYLEVTNNDADEKKNLAALEEKLASIEKRRSALTSKLETLKQQCSDSDEDVQVKKAKVLELDTELKTLERVSTSACDAFLRTPLGQNYRKLSECLSIEKEYEQTVRKLLHPYADLLIGSSPSSKVIEWAREEDANLRFLGSIDKNSSSDEFGNLSSVVRSDSELVTNFLTYFAIGADTCPENFIAAISKSGDCINRSVGSQSLQELIFNISNDSFSTAIRKKEISSLLKTNKDELLQVEKSLNKSKAEYSITKEEFAEVSSKWQSTNEEVITVKSRMNSGSLQFATNQGRLEGLKKKNKVISLERLNLNEKEEQYTNEIERTGKVLEEEKVRNVKLEETYEHSKELFHEKQEEFIKIKTQMSSSISRKQELESLLADMKNQKVRIDEKISSLKLNIEQSEKIVADIEDQESDYSEKINALSESLAQKEKELKQSKEELNILASGLEENEKEIQKLQSIVSKSEKIILEKSLKIEKYIEDEEFITKETFDTYRVDIRDVILSHLDVESVESLKDLSHIYYMDTDSGTQRIEPEAYEFSKKFPGQITETKDRLKNYKSQLNRLGHVNWEAVSDYENKKTRYDFLKMQEEELSHSINDLYKAIERIDVKSKERFGIAYDEVTSKFEQVFPIIFGGGNAKLQMVGNLADEDFGVEIVASPPGKKMQNINLMSGGEKALTAVALIFSIFLVKPSPFCLLDEVDAPLDDANVGRFNQLLREMSSESQFILITHNKKTMELNDKLYGITMQEPGVSKAVSVQLQ